VQDLTKIANSCKEREGGGKPSTNAHIRAPAERVYATLTTAKVFEEMTGAPTAIDASAGGALSCFGGVIHGRNIECVPGQRLVQAWRAKT
jgi:uncharacterized protein YndB with AHSA1/START domain